MLVIDVEIQAGIFSIVVLESLLKQGQSSGGGIAEKSLQVASVGALQFEYGRIGEIENNIHFPLRRGDAMFEHVADDGFGNQT